MLCIINTLQSTYTEDHARQFARSMLNSGETQNIMATTAQKINPAQEIVNALGISGPMSGAELRAATKFDNETLKREVYALIKEGIVTNDAGTFDVIPEYRADGRDSQEGQAGELAVEFDEPQATAPAPTAAKAQRSPAQLANDKRLAEQAKARKAGGTKATAPAPTAATKVAPVTTPRKVAATPAPAKAKAAATEAEPRTLYYDRALDTLSVPELQERVDICTAAAHANAQTGTPENMIVAEMLERTVMRLLRRLRGIEKGKTVIRQS